MNKFLNYLKTNNINLPIWTGLLLNKIPYSQRPGIKKLYRKKSIHIKQYSSYSEQEKKAYIFDEFFEIFKHAYCNIQFYSDLYKKNNIQLEDIKTFDDIEKIPIITKEDLRKYDLEERSYKIKNRLLVNTGGSSGNPFSFYTDPLRYGNEWAHIHEMWKIYGYRPYDLKLVLAGRVNVNNNVTYDFARNSLLYDIYGNEDTQANQLQEILKKYPIKYFHGYPSSIYEFAVYCDTNEALKLSLKKHLKAVFLSSESPIAHYRSKIEEIFGVPTQPFYGHTETCVMAYEVRKDVYNPYQTYGFAESVKYGDKYHLVGTSYYNYASPLIRYDTEDLIEPLNFNETILREFKITDGRIGEFISDKNGKKIPLTGLIFGRHHELFNYSAHIQVFQNNPGEATILFVPNKKIDINEASKMFNYNNVDIDFKFKKIDKPILSSSGKVNLKVNSIE